MEESSPFDGIEVEDMEAFVEGDNKGISLTEGNYRFENPPADLNSYRDYTYGIDVPSSSRSLSEAKKLDTDYQSNLTDKISESPDQTTSLSSRKEVNTLSSSNSMQKKTQRKRKPVVSSSTTSSLEVKDRWVRRSSRQTNANPKYSESGDVSFLEEDEDATEDDEEAAEDTDNTEDDNIVVQKSVSVQRRRKAAGGGGRSRRGKRLRVPELRIETLLGKKTAKDGTEQYLVKWHNMAYIHCTWESKGTIAKNFSNGTIHLTRFKRKAANGKVYIDINDDYFNPDYTNIDRIIAVRRILAPAVVAQEEALEAAEEGEAPPDEVEINQFYVKWGSLQYSECSWERERFLEAQGFSGEIEKFFEKAKYPRHGKGNSMMSRSKRSRDFEERKESPPDFEGGHTLRSYQLEGMNWLCFNWHKGRNSILADEMGLGKTVQSVALFHYLHRTQDIPGPFLVVAPLSTIAHWQREIQAWTQMHPVVYHGSSASRDVIRKYEWDKFLPEDINGNEDMDTKGTVNLQRVPGRYRFNILITTYEMVLRDAERLNNIHWACMIVDEAHRLKNRDSALFRALIGFNLHHVVLLTGTPIQNRIAELGTLLHFLEPKRFTDITAFETQFGDLKEKHQVDALHALLRPYLLRRMKGDVEKALPPREETLVEVQLTRAQKQYYKAIYEKNTEYLVSKTGSKPSLINIGMQLRKCCNHPFLLDGAEDAILNEDSSGKDGETEEKMERTFESDCQKMIMSCGKLVLVDKLLPKLKSQGHRVLVFSQMVRVLDILEDYLRYRNYSYERLDGTMKSADRQAGIDRFSKEGSDIFIFLLCTRAGGVGINLTAADTVIIYDSDWNPQNDIQAQARCHRIGQTKNVKVYRLVTANTYESEMFHRASMKLGLDKAVLHSMADVVGAAKNKSMKKSEVEALLKHGAYHVFLNTDESKADEFCEQDIDAILERSSRKITMGNDSSSSGGIAGNSTFSKATFVADDEKVDINDPQFWSKLGLKKKAPVSEYLGTRKRTLTRRFGMAQDDEDFAGSDGSGDAEFVLSSSRDTARDQVMESEPEEEKYFTNYSQEERDCFLKSLLQFGPFRWDEARGLGVHIETGRDKKYGEEGCPLAQRTDEELMRYFLGVILLHLKLVANSAIPSVQHTILSQILLECRRRLPADLVANAASAAESPTPSGKAKEPLNFKKSSLEGLSKVKSENVKQVRGSPSSSISASPPPQSFTPISTLERKTKPSGVNDNNDIDNDTVSDDDMADNQSKSQSATPTSSKRKSIELKDEKKEPKQKKIGTTKTGRKLATQTQRECEKLLETLGGCDPSLKSPVFMTRISPRARANLLVFERLWILHQIMVTPYFVPGAIDEIRRAKKDRARKLKMLRKSSSKSLDMKSQKQEVGEDKVKPEDIEDDVVGEKPEITSKWCRAGYWREFVFPTGYKLKEAKAGPPAEWWGTEDDVELVKGVYILGLGEEGYLQMREHPLLGFRRHQAEASKKATKGRQRAYDADGNKLWPSVSTLNKRVTMLITSLAKELKKAQKDDRMKKKKRIKQVKSAWMFFSKEAWNKVKEENPEASFAEIGKMVGEKWKTLTDVEKMPYDKQHKEDLQRYYSARRAMDQQEVTEEPIDSDSEDTEDDNPSESAKKSAKKVKAAKCAWVFFNKEKWAEVQAETPGSVFADVCKELAKRWKQLSADDKAPYVEMQNKDQERYNREIAARGKGGQGTGSRVKKKTPKVKVAKSAWMFFNRETWAKTKAENPDADFAEIGKMVGKHWRALTDEEKLPYQEQYKTDLVRYRSELKAAQIKAESAKDTVKSEKVKRKTKLKPVKSAWVYFSKQEWAKVKADNPDMSFGEVGKAVSERWKALNAEEKAPYMEAQKADAERYHKEKAEALEGSPPSKSSIKDESIISEKGTKSSKPKSKKKVKSAWSYFSKNTWGKVKANNPSADFKEIGRKVGELWKGLSQEEKLPYVEMRNADTRRVKEEEKAQNALNSGSNDAPQVQIVRRKVNPPRPSYMFFARRFWKENTELAEKEAKEAVDKGAADDSTAKKTGKFIFSTVSKRMGEKWKVLPLDVKQQFRELAAKDRQRYQTELEAAEKDYNAKLAKVEGKKSAGKSEVHNGSSGTDVDDSTTQKKTESGRNSIRKRRREVQQGEQQAKKPRLGLLKAEVKKAKSAWMYFSMAMWDTVRGDIPDAMFGDIGKYLGEAWKTLDEDEKAPYMAKHLQDKERFNTEMIHTRDDVTKRPKDKALMQTISNLKAEEKVIRPAVQNGKELFVNELKAPYLKQYPNWTWQQIQERLTYEWSVLSDFTRKEYEDRAAKDRIRYESEKKEEKAQISTASSNASYHEKKFTPMQNYTKKNREKICKEYPDAKQEEINSIVAARWKALTALEKKSYEDVSSSAVKSRKRRADGSKKEDGSDRKRVKRDKDGKPKVKNALSAWMFFSKDKWSSVQAEHPNDDFATIGRILGTKWKALTPKEKEPYVKQHQQDVERYFRERKDLGLPALGDKSSSRRGSTKKIRPPTTAFVFFSRELRPKIKKSNPEITPDQVRKMLSEAWRTIDPKDKQQYLDLHHKEVRRYREEKKKFDEEKAAAAAIASTNTNQSSSSKVITSQVLASPAIQPFRGIAPATTVQHATFSQDHIRPAHIYTGTQEPQLLPSMSEMQPSTNNISMPQLLPQDQSRRPSPVYHHIHRPRSMVYNEHQSSYDNQMSSIPKAAEVIADGLEHDLFLEARPSNQIQSQGVHTAHSTYHSSSSTMPSHSSEENRREISYTSRPFYNTQSATYSQAPQKTNGTALPATILRATAGERKKVNPFRAVAVDSHSSNDQMMTGLGQETSNRNVSWHGGLQQRKKFYAPRASHAFFFGGNNERLLRDTGLVLQQQQQQQQPSTWAFKGLNPTMTSGEVQIGQPLQSNKGGAIAPGFEHLA
mmetsp:Transcript_1235/g.1738  ORF Transcript_1235/g.1738 Transcript_1235/m.1738 type:complete len:2914 (-) Transcript_1235:233-8974(-)|eukprot:CAMPEP_0167761778 /NCGR_PEP_ID=MMETSP0110_2-20121227/12370_1 /TAXON_ID=629695 /ORGANISM="Gymnochlora sp., Strain CCMP2014" /LENGTH=2913 /DNA_ID=CAMNT_0007648517 /DNA_START=95 /DNA_END=8836 /DNA_ORIENTATION=-